MNIGVDHVRADVDAQFAESEDAESVAQNRQGNHCESENGTFPWGAEKKMAGDQTCDEQREARVNAAAFGRHLEIYSRQPEDQVVVENGGASKTKERVGHISGAMLEKSFQGGSHDDRKRNHEDEEAEGKGDGAQGCAIHKPTAKADEKEQERSGEQGEGIFWGERNGARDRHLIAGEYEDAQ